MEKRVLVALATSILVFGFSLMVESAGVRQRSGAVSSRGSIAGTRSRSGTQEGGRLPAPLKGSSRSVLKRQPASRALPRISEIASPLRRTTPSRNLPTRSRTDTAYSGDLPVFFGK